MCELACQTPINLADSSSHIPTSQGLYFPNPLFTPASGSHPPPLSLSHTHPIPKSSSYVSKHLSQNDYNIAIYFYSFSKWQ